MMVMEEVDQLANVLDKTMLNVAASPRWVVAVEISGHNQAGGPSVILRGFVNCIMDD